MERPGAILFACSQNAVRSPMAERIARHELGRGTYVQSAGVLPGEADPFVAAVLDEIGLDLGRHRPRTFEELEDIEGFNFDLVVTLSPEAHHKALEYTRSMALDVEYWPTPDPTAETGSRDRRLDAYRAVRDGLQRKIRARFFPGR